MQKASSKEQYLGTEEDNHPKLAIISAHEIHL
jgi:hypothetical protein